jgi:TctA family transporter
VLRVAILIVALLLLFLIYKRFKDDKKFNFEIGSLVMLLLIMISLYEYNSNKTREKVTKLLVSFKEGKTLICQDAKVDKEHFDYESGTMVFISKKIVDIKYPIQGCKQQKE